MSSLFNDPVSEHRPDMEFSYFCMETCVVGPFTVFPMRIYMYDIYFHAELFVCLN